MRFTTLSARYPGRCKRCGFGFPAGTSIRYGGKGFTYHLSTDPACMTSRQADAPARDARLKALQATSMGLPPNALDAPQASPTPTDAILRLERANRAVSAAYANRNATEPAKRSLSELAALLSPQSPTETENAA